MPTQEKIDRVAELRDKLERSSIVIATGYTGMGANQMVTLRRRLREGGVDFIVVKNNLLNLAADAAAVPQLKSVVSGQTAIAVGYDDAAIIAKAVNDAAGAAGALSISGAVVNRGEAMLAAEVSRLAALPPQPALLAQLLGNMQAPLYGLASVLNGVVRGLAYVLQARIDQLQPAAGDAGVDDGDDVGADDDVSDDADDVGADDDVSDDGDDVGGDDDVSDDDVSDDDVSDDDVSDDAAGSLQPDD